jgi:hypothetical protein
LNQLRVWRFSLLVKLYRTSEHSVPCRTIMDALFLGIAKRDCVATNNRALAAMALKNLKHRKKNRKP